MGRVEDNAPWYVTTSGSGTAYAAALSPAPAAYTAGMVINFKANVSNTGPCTLAINGLSARSIYKNVTEELSADDIKQNQIITVIYDGTNFQLASGSGTGGGAISRISGSYTASSDGVASNIPIGIENYNPYVDILDIYYGNGYLELRVHFKLDELNRTIDLLGWSLDTGETLYFKVYKNILSEEATADALKLTYITTTYTATGTESHIPINSVYFNKAIDKLYVYYKNAYLYESVEYTITDDSDYIDLLDWTIAAGDIIRFEIAKVSYAPINPLDCSTAIPGTLSQTAFDTALQTKMMNLDNLLISHTYGVKW